MQIKNIVVIIKSTNTIQSQLPFFFLFALSCKCETTKQKSYPTPWNHIQVKSRPATCNLPPAVYTVRFLCHHSNHLCSIVLAQIKQSILLKRSCCNHAKSNCLISFETQLKTTEKNIVLSIHKLPGKGLTGPLSHLHVATPHCCLP